MDFLRSEKSIRYCRASTPTGKVAKIGIRGKALLWLKSYLEGKSQFVTVNEVTSKLQDVMFGVPQGSILGPLLFIIYMNDLEKVGKVIKPTLFSDDTNLLIIRKNLMRTMLKLKAI